MEKKKHAQNIRLHSQNGRSDNIVDNSSKKLTLKHEHVLLQWYISVSSCLSSQLTQWRLTSQWCRMLMHCMSFVSCIQQCLK